MLSGFGCDCNSDWVSLPVESHMQGCASRSLPVRIISACAEALALSLARSLLILFCDQLPVAFRALSPFANGNRNMRGSLAKHSQAPLRRTG